MSFEELYVYEPPEIHDDDPIYEAAAKQIEAFRPAKVDDLIEAVESDPSFLVVRREDAEKALNHLSRDMHMSSRRPCATCQRMTEVFGRSFGCVVLSERVSVDAQEAP